jgi:IS30 family transposase
MICARRKKTAHVCNGCGFMTECNFEKKLYRASVAQQEYKTLLSEARSGIGFTEEELKELDAKVSPLIRQGQSPHHISVNNRDSLMVSEATIYRLIDSGLITARNLDLPRKVRFKARKRKKSIFKVDRSCRVGRDYACFQRFMDNNPDTPVIQLDSVIGKKGGKVLLTVHFVNCEMMLAFLRDSNDAKSVEDVFDSLYQSLGHECFSNIFRLCLADNGSEFSNPARIEFTPDGKQRTRVFFCDPQAPYQKGSFPYGLLPKTGLLHRGKENADFIQPFLGFTDTGLVNPFQFIRMFFRMPDPQGLRRPDDEGGTGCLPPVDPVHLAIVHQVADSQGIGHTGIFPKHEPHDSHA